MTKNLYFAYGSNLYESRMAYRCPAATPLVRAYLPGHELTFMSNGKRGVANIVPARRKKVPGMIWYMGPWDAETLDGYEGAPFVYDRYPVIVKDDNGKAMEVFTYRMVGDSAPYALPDESYFDMVYKGYTAFKLDRLVLSEAVMEAARQVEAASKKRKRKLT